MFWLKSLYKKYTNLVPLLGSWASLFALLLMFHPGERGLAVIHWFLIILAILCTIVTLYVEIRKRTKIHVFPEENKRGINQYMVKWMGDSGRVAIFSRDMSFASSNKEIKKLLLSKSEKSEVTICLPKEVPLTNELSKKGAKIHAYSRRQDFSPQTRFTIVNYGQGTKERVAVAHGENGFHVIQEFSKEDLVIYLAKDLIDLAIRLAAKDA